MDAIEHLRGPRMQGLCMSIKMRMKASGQLASQAQPAAEPAAIGDGIVSRAFEQIANGNRLATFDSVMHFFEVCFICIHPEQDSDSMENACYVTLWPPHGGFLIILHGHFLN